jgi:TonB family protein
MHRFRAFSLLVALAPAMVGCGARPVAATAPTPPLTQPPPPAAQPPPPAAQPPPPATQPPSSSVPAPAAQAPVRVDPATTTSASPPLAPPALLRNVSRWRSAIENYVSAVKPGNQLALEGAKVQFAQYLNLIHTRIHSIFTNQFLASLDQTPHTAPINRSDLLVTLEIILEAKEGRIRRMGVVEPSGVTLFDLLALEAVDRAQPFGPPPREIASPDGLVYFHWQFKRGPEACGPWNARPFLLESSSNTGPTP